MSTLKRNCFVLYEQLSAQKILKNTTNTKNMEVENINQPTKILLNHSFFKMKSFFVYHMVHYHIQTDIHTNNAQQGHSVFVQIEVLLKIRKYIRI